MQAVECGMDSMEPLRPRYWVAAGVQQIRYDFILSERYRCVLVLLVFGVMGSSATKRGRSAVAFRFQSLS
jgi:hypothetical protein